VSFAAVRDAGMFLSGATGALAAVAALLFLKFRRRTGDRFFTLFSAAFALMAANRFGILFAGPSSDHVIWFYLIRLFAYLIILAAIVDKNVGRPSRR
jgi:hypothetical protein